MNQWVDVLANEGEGEVINALWRQAGFGDFLIYTDTIIRQEFQLAQLDLTHSCLICTWNQAIPLYAERRGRVFFLNLDEFSEHFTKDVIIHNAKINWLIDNQSLFESMHGLPDAINAANRITVYHQEQTFKDLPIQPQSKVFQYCYRFDCHELWRDYLVFKNHPSPVAWQSLSAHHLPIAGHGGLVWRDTVGDKHKDLMLQLNRKTSQRSVSPDLFGSAFPSLFEVDKIFQQAIAEAGEQKVFTALERCLFYKKASTQRLTER